MAIKLLNNIADLSTTVEVVFPCGDTVELNKLSVLDYARYESYIVEMRSLQYNLYKHLSDPPVDMENEIVLREFNNRKRELLTDLANCVEYVKENVLYKYVPNKYLKELELLGIDGLIALFEALLFGEPDEIEELNDENVDEDGEIKKKK